MQIALTLTKMTFVVGRTGAKLALHIGETTISFPFTPQQARSVTNSINSLLETFAAKQKAERPRRWDMMEYRSKGALVSPCHALDTGCLVWAFKGGSALCKAVRRMWHVHRASADFSKHAEETARVSYDAQC